MRVLIANTLYPPYSIGGAERSVKVLAEALVKSGIETVVVCTHPHKTVEDEWINGVHVYRLPIGNIYWPYGDKGHTAGSRFVWHCNDIFSKSIEYYVLNIIGIENFDIIHTNNIVGLTVSIWAAAHKSSLPIMHTLRDYSLLCPRTTMFKHGENCNDLCVSCRFIGMKKRAMSLFVSGIVGVSDYTLNKHLRHGFFSNSIIRETQFNAIEASLKEPVTVKRDDRVVRFGFIGRIARDKGVETLLDALSRVAKNGDQNRGWSLNLFGAGEERYINELKRRWNNPRIVYNGHVSPDLVYSNLDVVIVPSLWNEPLSRVIIESLWQGLGVVASDVGGTADLIGQNRIGRLFRAGDVDELGTIFQELLKNGTQSLPRPKTGDPIFTMTAPETVARNHINLYERVIASALTFSIP